MADGAEVTGDDVVRALESLPGVVRAVHEGNSYGLLIALGADGHQATKRINYAAGDGAVQSWHHGDDSPGYGWRVTVTTPAGFLERLGHPLAT